MEISLDGTEITIIKAIGLSGEAPGERVMERAIGIDDAALIDALKGLIDTGYVLTDLSDLRSLSDLKAGKFHVNSGYMKAIKAALDPDAGDKKPKRVRRE